MRAVLYSGTSPFSSLKKCVSLRYLVPSFVGSMEAHSRAFLLPFLLPDWLKLNHLKSRMECGFSDISRAIFVPP